MNGIEQSNNNDNANEWTISKPKQILSTGFSYDLHEFMQRNSYDDFCNYMLFSFAVALVSSNKIGYSESELNIDEWPQWKQHTAIFFLI